MAASPRRIQLAVVAGALVFGLARARQNLALHKPVTASSARFGAPSAVVNGVVEWGNYALHTAHERPALVMVDLEGTFRVDEVRVYGRGDGSFGEDAPPLAVELSLDGRTFAPAGTCNGIFTQVSPCHVWPHGTPARYVRLKYPYIVVSELEVYGAR